MDSADKDLVRGGVGAALHFKLSASRLIPRSRRSTGIAVGLLLAVGLAYWFVIRAPRSLQGFVNTDLIALRAPIAGRLALPADAEVGKAADTGQSLGRIDGDVENPRASQLHVQREELVGQIANLEERAHGIEIRLADRETLIAAFEEEDATEKRLRATYQRAQLGTAEEDLHRVLARAAVAGSSERRTRSLFDSGVVSRARLEDSVGAGTEAAAEVNAQKARVKQQEAQVEASNVGLDLGGARALSQAQTRLRELRSDVVDLQQTAADLQRTLESARAELAVVEAELSNQKAAALTSPRPSVIWSIDAQSGETIAANAPILHLADCRHVWVEAFFDEPDAARLSIGRRVSVRLLDGSKAWSGTVETVRAGTGRVAVGDYVVQPPPEIARRQLPVRVVTARIRVAWTAEDLMAEEFCLAGRSVEVVLDR